MKRINATGIVNIVSYNQYSYGKPLYGQYDHLAVSGFVPCRKTVDGRYFDLRTDAEVKPAEDTCIWDVLPGTVLQYPDGKMLLITRYFADKALGCGFIKPEDFNPNSMLLRTVFDTTNERTA